ncbi:mannitol dehydrogenase family protein [Kozakia baliensis]|uniref:D-mannonate oxidoreductase n=1 Tax=Kozakia baliensis TaxID=153496 RepID=A0A1D8UU85_9PROT|nr:mannitol dehydrogenase family protein [Kozakia baliensis]AOX17206.1 D-mannonate oxidoreductase [Kozakia baliensis]GBR32286.1 D-mannonate oxidoreductase [Kozakia baliensis NRIC 0488]GEL64537.1 mannitol dehydrogenase [Kozakia baliensis]
MRLSRVALPYLPENVYRPQYDLSGLTPGILHLGCGNFHRAHQAVATQAAINLEGKDGLRWGIVGATMRSPTLVERLRPQDNLYTLLTRLPDRTAASIIGSIHAMSFTGDPLSYLPERLADPQIRIVSLTVTASGYYLTAEGRLDPQADAIRADLISEYPRTALGILALGLAIIRERGTTPPVILCCDNVSNNGATLRQAVLDFVSLRGDDALGAWIAAHVQFPDTMVDRIAPTTSANDVEDALAALEGIHDEAPISAEPWFQWIIGPFEGPRPHWEAHPGTKFVSDVGLFERAKLQMLNGSHMLLAYAGALAGLNTIAEAASDPMLGRIAARFIRHEQDAGIGLSAQELDDYAHDLMERFRNPGIVHEAERVGRNGSVKMADRVIRPMRENLEAGRSVNGARLLIACWIRWFALHEQDALDLALADPRANVLRKICAQARHDHEAQTEAFFAMEEVFGPPLPQHEKEVKAIASILRRLTEEQVPTLLQELAA